MSADDPPPSFSEFMHALINQLQVVHINVEFVLAMMKPGEPLSEQQLEALVEARDAGQRLVDLIRSFGWPRHNRTP